MSFFGLFENDVFWTFEIPGFILRHIMKSNCNRLTFDVMEGNGARRPDSLPLLGAKKRHSPLHPRVIRNQSQFIVACEFGYPEDVVYKAMEKYKFDKASNLIDFLEKIVSKSSPDEWNIEPAKWAFLTGELLDPPLKDGANSESAVMTKKTTVAEDPVVTVKKTEQSSLRAATERLYVTSMCLVCNKNRRTRLSLPCCHLTHCNACDASTRSCPYEGCGELIRDTIVTYF